MLVFRIVHITAGVLWVGSVFLLTTAIAPAAEAIAPAGAPFLGELLGKRRLVDRIIGLGTVTVVGGLFLYWHDWHLFPSFGDWLTSRFGGSLTIGMVSALIALGIGGSITRPNARRMLALGAQVAASGAPPTPEVAAEIGAIATAPEGGRARGTGVPPVRGARDVGGALPLSRTIGAARATAAGSRHARGCPRPARSTPRALLRSRRAGRPCPADRSRGS